MCSLQRSTRLARVRRTRRKAILGALTLAACGADDPPPGILTCADIETIAESPDLPVAYATEHLDIFVSEDRFLCAGSAQEYERFYASVGEELELELAQTVPLYVIRGVSEYCGFSALGCRMPDGTVFSSRGVVRHELAHAATCEWKIQSTQALTEGLAVSFEPSDFYDYERMHFALDYASPAILELNPTHTARAA